MSLLRSVYASDFEIWSSVNTSYNLYSCWSLEGIVQARFRDSASKAYLYFAELNLAWDLSRGWQIVPGYRPMYRRVGRNRWKFESLFHASIIKEVEVCGYELAIRNRGEYRSLEKAWILRERLSCIFPQQLTCLNFRPSIYGEVFFRTGTGFSQSRLFGGFSGDCLTIGYIYRWHKPSENWVINHILFIGGQWDF